MSDSNIARLCADLTQDYHEENIIEIDYDITIDGDVSDLSVFPIDLGNRHVDFNRHTIRLTSCGDWTGLFRLNGGSINRLTVTAEPSCQITGSLLVDSSRALPCTGYFTNINVVVESRCPLDGVLVGRYALSNGGVIQFRNIHVMAKAPKITGPLLGSNLVSGCQTKARLKFDDVVLNLEAEQISGLIAGDNMGHDVGPDFAFSVDCQHPITRLKGGLRADGFSQSQHFFFGVDGNPDIKMAVLSNLTGHNRDDPWLGGLHNCSANPIAPLLATHEKSIYKAGDQTT